MKFEQLKKIVECYALLDEKERKEINSKINDAWWSMSEEFAKMCKEDVKCEELREQVSDIRNTMSFNFDKTVSDFIYEGVSDEYDTIPQHIQDEIYKDYKYRHDNLNELNKEIDDELNYIKSKRFVINRDKKIKKLEDLIEYNNNVFELYEYCEEMNKKRKYYKDNYSEVVKPLEDEYTSIMREHAKEVLLETVKKSPEIVCKDHKFVVCGCLNGDQGKILNEVFTDFTDVLHEKINKAEQKEFEDIIAKNTFKRK